MNLNKDLFAAWATPLMLAILAAGDRAAELVVTAFPPGFSSP